MAIAGAELQALVSKFEIEAASSPRRYKTRVAALAALGYAYLAAVLLFSVGVPVLLVVGLFEFRSAGLVQIVVKLALPLLGLAAIILRSLWVRFTSPEGIRPARAA